MKKGTNICIRLGVLLLAAAVLLSGYNLIQRSSAAKSSSEIFDRLDKMLSQVSEDELPNYVLDPEMDMPVKEIDGVNYIGVLQIPSLGLNLPIAENWSYSQLMKSPCRYFGTAYKSNFVIAAHNYPTHFGNLKKLHEGDSVIFTDMDGNGFNYEVAELETLLPTDVEEMKGGDWDLTLFTCTIGGRTRVTVRCVAVAE